MKKLVAGIVLYVIGGFLTNAYCQVHRWDDWNVRKSSLYDPDSGKASRRLVGATVAWPVYWTSRASIWICRHSVEIRQPGEPEG